MKLDTILVVEDDAAVRDVMQTLLQTAGYPAAGAANGREALDYLARAGPPCLILLDLHMPVLDGWGFRREQQRDGDLADIPVIVVSSEAEAARQADSPRAAAYFRKPVAVEALLRSIRSVLHVPPAAASGP